MKKLLLLTLSFTLSAGYTDAQTYDWRSDTLATGIGYSEDAYFHLDSGQVLSTSNNNWDLAFPGAGSFMRYSVHTNNFGNGQNAKVYDLGVEPSSFGTDLTPDTAGKVALNNLPESWDEGSMDNWGTYDISTHHLNGSTVFAYIASHGAYQIVIEKYKPSSTLSSREWTIKVANLDGTEQGEYTIQPYSEGFTDEHFFYFDLRTRAFLSREPKYGKWHLLATKYGDQYSESSPAIMGITGMLTAPTVQIAEVRSLLPSEADYASITAYDSTRNVIGGNYKVINYSTYEWELIDSLSYFIKALDNDENAGDIWQIYYDYFPAATSGDVKIGVQIRKVYSANEEDTSTSISNNVDNNCLLIVSPNPAKNFTNIAIDSKESLSNSTLSIVDISGKVVQQFTINIHQGFQQFSLNVSQLPAGLYLIQMHTKDGGQFIEKLIVQ